MACLSQAAAPKIGIKFCACVGWRRLLYNSVEQRRDSACQCRGSVLEKGAGAGAYGVCTQSRCVSTLIHGWLGPREHPRLIGYEFLNKKLIRGSRRMDAVAAKSDAVIAWKCTATDAYRRLQTLTDAYRRWFPVRGFCSFRVWPCQSVPQCDRAFRTLITLRMREDLQTILNILRR